MIQGKKGIEMEMGTLVKMIIAVASFIIILAFVMILLGNLQNESVEQSCRASVVGRMGVREILNEKTSEFYPLQCKTQNIRLPEESLTRAEKADEELSKEHIEKEIADLMAKCWWMFGNGHFHDIFADKFKNENRCHICYSFVISPSVEALQTQGIELSEFKLYPSENKYDPGLLQGGGVNIGGYGEFSFEPQNVKESSRESRQLTAERVIGGKTRLNLGLADFSGIYTNKESLKLDIQTQVYNNDALENSIIEKGIAPAIVIVPSLTEESYKNHPNLARELLEEWNVGQPDRDNGILFLFALNDGKLIYASEVGAHAVLAKGAIEELLLEKLELHMRAGTPEEGIKEFVTDLNGLLNSKTKEIVAFQRTYEGYIGGGVTGSSVSTSISSSLSAKGAIMLPSTGLTELKLGERYAIAFTSPQWTSNLVSWWGDKTVPSAIVLDKHDNFLTSGALCNVQEE